MRSKKLKMIGWRGVALLLTVGLLLPGISQAAIVSGETTHPSPAGAISVAVTVDDIMTTISITWPENRWVGINFGPPPAHTDGYIIMSSLNGDDVFEANAKVNPRELVPQDLLNQDLTVVDNNPPDGGFKNIVVERFSNTGDGDDFLFAPIDGTRIALQWALGPEGFTPDNQHQFRGDFIDALVLTAVPVPAALPLLASGLFALGLFTRRKKAA